MPHMPATETRGHRSDAPGLRGHSTGQDYPLTVIMVGSQWTVFHCGTGRTGHLRPTYLAAYQDLVSVRLRDMMHG